jgi:thymidylate synthase (FAD)
MILIRPSFEIMNFNADLLLIERAGRTCYKSEAKITEDSAGKFIASILKNGHETVIEHSSITVKIICDRGVTHEIVRHRIASYSQESTRYCNYSGGAIFIIPPWVKIEPGEYSWKDIYGHRFEFDGDHQWATAMTNAEQVYVDLLKLGWSPQQARSVLPNSLKTEIVMTCNLREWRHFLKLRTASAAHPQMREIAEPILKEFAKRIPIVFDDLIRGQK